MVSCVDRSDDLARDGLDERTRWKPACNAFEIAFDVRLVVGRR
jgi:hypothetical protein